MAAPPLLLEDSIITKLAVEANQAHKPDQNAKTDTTVGVGLTGEPDAEGRWRVRLAVTVSGNPASPPPYAIDLEVIGAFTVPAETPPAERTRLLAVTGGSILYSAAREFLLLVTGRGPWGPFQLPTVRLNQPPSSSVEPEHAPAAAPAPKAPRQRRSTAKTT